MYSSLVIMECTLVEKDPRTGLTGLTGLALECRGEGKVYVSPSLPRPWKPEIHCVTLVKGEGYICLGQGFACFSLWLE